MTFRVQVENFQSVVQADLEVSGLTTITGQNNSGKSAIMRAVRGVFTNPGNGSSYIHHGKDHFRVRVDFNDGAYIVWERLGRRASKGKKKGKLVDLKTNYEVNGVRYDGVGNSVPEVVLAQGIGPITVGRDQVWPQLAKQVKGVFFLVDRPGSHTAEAVANVDKVAVLNAAMRDCDKDLRSNTSELKLRRQDRQSHKDKLEALVGLETVVERVEDIEALHKQVTRIDKGITTVTGLRDRLATAQSEVQRLTPVLRIETPSDEDLEGIKEIYRSLRETREIQQRLATVRKTRDQYTGANELTAPGDDQVESVRRTLERLETARKFQQGLEKARLETARLKPVEALSEADLDKGLQTLQKVAKGLEVYGELRGRLHKAWRSTNALKQDVSKATHRVEEIQSELDEFLASNPKCPTCGQFRELHQEAS